MNSARRVKQLMADMDIPDEKIFGSQAFGNYLQMLLSIPCRTIGKSVPPVVMHLPKDAKNALGCWDGQKICVGSEENFITALPNRECKAAVLTGIVVHEYGHYRFTDLAGRNTAIKKLSKGTWYPALPEELPDYIEDYKAEVEEFITANAKENPKEVKKLLDVWHDIYNIMEDGYIEECLYRCMSGILIDGLNSIRFFQLATAMTLKDILPEIGHSFDMYDAVSALLLSYCKFGTMKCNWDNPEESESEPVKWVAEARGYIDQVLYVSSTTRRLKGVHMTFLTLWPIIKEHIAHMPDPDDSGASGDGREGPAGAMRSSRYEGKGDGKPVPVDKDEDTGKSGSRAARKETSKHLSGEDEDKEKSAGGGSEDGEDGEEGSSGKESEDGEDGEGGTAGTLPKDMDHTPPEDGELEMPDVPDEGSGMTIEDIEESFSVEEVESTMRRIETDIKSETAIDIVNDELTKELDEAAKSLSYGAAHRGICPKVGRVTTVSETAKSVYDSTMDTIKSIAATAARRVKPILQRETDQNRMAMSGYYSGSRFDATRLVMNDCRVFKNATTPLPDTRVAVTVLVDESGSMNGDRIVAARTAAIALYEFCAACEIPCSVIGHTADFSTGQPVYDIFADFETPDKLDKYRLLNISAKWDNRDGAAILFAGEQLLKREEPVKLMFIISDGAPCAKGYYGTPAENDMSNIVANLRRKGETIFAAAIGSDKENIRRIFGEGFLDITDINTLPDQLLQLVKKYIR